MIREFIYFRFTVYSVKISLPHEVGILYYVKSRAIRLPNPTTLPPIQYYSCAYVDPLLVRLGGKYLKRFSRLRGSVELAVHFILSPRSHSRAPDREASRMMLPKWKLALFKREFGIQPGKIIQALWQLPAMEVVEPPAPGFFPAESNGAWTRRAHPGLTEDYNYLGAGSKVKGKFNSLGPARIDGEFEGEITATDSVTLGENAVVTAKIKAASIIVAGTFDGDMTASDSIEIRASAKVSGNLAQGPTRSLSRHAVILLAR
jgi:hypothetical protein